MSASREFAIWLQLSEIKKAMLIYRIWELLVIEPLFLALFLLATLYGGIGKLKGLLYVRLTSFRQVGVRKSSRSQEDQRPDQTSCSLLFELSPFPCSAMSSPT